MLAEPQKVAKRIPREPAEPPPGGAPWAPARTDHRDVAEALRSPEGATCFRTYGSPITGRNPAVTSVVTLAEVLTRPKSMGRGDLVAQYREYLEGATRMRLIPIDPTVAEQAADLRARHSLRLPDAFQIAASLNAGAAFFLCNDARLKQIQALKVVLLSEISE